MLLMLVINCVVLRLSDGESHLVTVRMGWDVCVCVCDCVCVCVTVTVCVCDCVCVCV